MFANGLESRSTITWTYPDKMNVSWMTSTYDGYSEIGITSRWTDEGWKIEQIDDQIRRDFRDIGLKVNKLITDWGEIDTKASELYVHRRDSDDDDDDYDDYGYDS
jgi:hypothetical protein